MNAATTAVLTMITTALQIINAAEPDIAAIINLLKGTSDTLASMLADANSTEQSDVTKAQGEES